MQATRGASCVTRAPRVKRYQLEARAVADASWSSISVVMLAGIVACSSEAPAQAPVVHRLDAAAGRLALCLGLSSPSVVGYLGAPEIGGASEETKRCLRGAEDCDSVLSCAGYAAEPCEAGCDGDIARNCFVAPNGLSIATYENCAENADGNGSCDLVLEDKGNYALCHDSQMCSESRCEEGVGLFCDGGHEVAFPCGSDELCLTDGVSTSCVREQPCERDHCDASGEVLYLCERGRLVLEARCESVLPGTRCVQNSIFAQCEARVADPSCMAEPQRSFCDGNLAVACNSGVRYEIDCTAVDGRCLERNGAATCQ
jgi:hypothetical protein